MSQYLQIHRNQTGFKQIKSRYKHFFYVSGDMHKHYVNQAKLVLGQETKKLRRILWNNTRHNFSATAERWFATREQCTSARYEHKKMDVREATMNVFSTNSKGIRSIQTKHLRTKRRRTNHSLSKLLTCTKNASVLTAKIMNERVIWPHCFHAT